MGALTSKPYTFTARPWELRNVETIDIGDTECVPIRVQLKGNQILRILPLLNSYTKSDWISDRTRFSYDGFYNQRLSTIFFTNQFLTVVKNNRLNMFQWTDILNLLNQYLSINLANLLFIVNRKLTNQEWETLGKVASLRGQSNLVFSQINETNNFSSDLLPFFTLLDADQKLYKTDLLITIGFNMREQFPILYTKLRQRFSSNANLNYYYLMSNDISSHTDIDFGINLGNSLSTFRKIFEGKHILTREILRSQNPLILVGGVVMSNHYFFNFMSILYGFTNKISRLLQSNVTVGLLATDVNHFAANYYNIGLDDNRQYWQQNNVHIKLSNIIPTEITKSISQSTIFGNNDILTISYVLGSPSFITTGQTFSAKSFDIFIYHSSHYQTEYGFITNDFALPDFSIFEKSGVYYNGTGISQTSNVVVTTSKKINNFDDAPMLIDTFLSKLTFTNSFQARVIEFDNLNPMTFSESLLANTFFKNNAYQSQMLLHNFFGNTIAGYDYLLTDDLSVNSPTLNLMKHLNARSQSNFIN